MSFVLAIEQDDTQAQLLRTLVCGPDTELVIVVSVQAAIGAMNRRMPDLLLVSEALESRPQEAIAQVRGMANAANVRVLPIPSFDTADPEAFAAEVTLCLLLNKKEEADKEDGKAAPIDADVHQAHIALLQADADARLAEELARVRREAEEQRAVELERLEVEAEEKRRAAVAEARAAAAEEARRALTAELASVRSEAENMLAAELARVQSDAAEKLASQLAEADAHQSAAAREARAAAEQAAARALEAEAERVRAEAESRLQKELARVRAEQELANQALQRAQMEADATREAAVREAREHAAREAGAAAEAAARAQEAELARLRAEADVRLRAEAAKRKEQLEMARAADRVVLEQVRQAAEREARERAEAALQAEIVRARAEAEAKLAAEIAEAQAEADRRRDAELAEIRVQLAHANAMARQDARGTPADTASDEVARADGSLPVVTVEAARPGSHAAATTIRVAGVAVRGMGRASQTVFPLIRDVWDLLPTGTIPTIAATLLIAAAIALVDVSVLTRRTSSLAEGILERSVKVLPAGRSGRPAPQEDPTPDPSRDDLPRPAVAQGPGMLSVYSRVLLELYVSGKRIGTTEDQQIMLPPGTYRVELVSSRLNYRGTVPLTVQTASLTAHTVTLPNGSLQVTTEPGAEVSVEGERMGVAPLGLLPVQIGTREVVVTHPDLGERREFVEVRYDGVTEVTILRRDAVDPAKAYPLPDLAQPGAPIR